MVLYLTFSRGSLVALAAGSVALLLSRPTRSALAGGALALAAGTIMIAALQLFPAVLELGYSSSDQTAQGAAVAVILALVMLAVGAGFARLLRGPGASAVLELGTRTRLTAAALSLAAVLVLGWLIVDSSETTEPLSSSKGRLTTIATNRADYWSVALGEFGDRPLAGDGAGSFGVSWRRERRSDEFALDAHSLYVETLGELGLVGALLLAAFLAAALAAVAGRGPNGAPDPLRVAAAACLIALLVHVALDWTWEFPAVVLVPLILVAAVMAAPRGAPPDGSPGAVAPRRRAMRQGIRR